MLLNVENMGEESSALPHRGYHPVHLGDTFKDGTYEVVHKLGYGGFSTVWLVKEGQYVSFEQKLLHRNYAGD